MLKKSATGVLASLRGSRYRSVRLASSLAAALPAERRVSARRGRAGETSGLFEHPARLSLSCPRLADHRSSAVPKWFFLSLLAACDPFLTVRLVQVIEDVVGFRQHYVPILEDRNIVLA